MDDEAYVRELFAILANPSPSGIDPADPYGRADDRIDRYDGFGRDLRVTSAAVVPGEHGAMVEIGYVLDLSAGSDLDDVPRENSVRLPVSAEWRAASDLDDPADYAPLVAHHLMMSVHRHVSAHQPATRATADLVARDDQWAMLLEQLAREGSVREVAPGRVEVMLARGGTERGVLTVLVTPGQWEQVLLRHGNDLSAGDYFVDLLGPRKSDELFLVYWDGDLERSVREALPPVRPWRPVQFVPGASWSAFPPSGE